MQKVKLTRAKLLKMLQDNKFEKKAVALILEVDEASVRRACTRLDINTDEEKKKAVASWKAKKIAIPHKGHGKFQPNSFLVYSDLHDVDVDWPAFSSVCEFARDFKPQYVIQIGDLLEYGCLLGKGKQKYPNFDGKDIYSLNRGFTAAAKIVAQINQASPEKAEKIFTTGNHEYRAVELIKRHPEFRKLLSVEDNLDMTGWKMLEYLTTYKLGKLNFIHGEFYGANHVKKHLMHYQKNVLYGHTHDVAQETMASPMRKIATWGASCGCLCNLSPDWQRHKTSKWQHGFAYGWFDPESGDFDAVPKRIINGGFWAEGRRYRA